MKRSLLWSAAAAAALAQDTTTAIVSSSSSSADASSTTESGTPTSRASFTHTVAVGRGGHTYAPDLIFADAGDTIEFAFYPTNHSVIRAAYLTPCIPYELLVPREASKGFNSGFLPVDAILDEPPTWRLLVNDTEPIFFYCGAEGSCIDQQMVGVINPNASVSLARQKDEAGQADYMLLPGEGWPDEKVEEEVMNDDHSDTGPPSSGSSSSGSSSSGSSSSGGGGDSGLSKGAIAGIAVGATVAALAGAAGLFFCGRQSRRRKDQQKLQQQQQQPLMYQRQAPGQMLGGAGAGGMMGGDPNAAFGAMGMVPQQQNRQSGWSDGRMSGMDWEKHMSMQSQQGYGSPGMYPMSHGEGQQGYMSNMSSPPQGPMGFHEMEGGLQGQGGGRGQVGEMEGDSTVGGSTVGGSTTGTAGNGETGIMGFLKKQNTESGER